MAALFPVLFFVLTLIAFARFRPDADLRKSFLNAAVVWGCVVTGLTEGLSPFGQLTATALKVSWLVASCLAAGVAVWSVCVSRKVGPIRWGGFTRLELAMCASITVLLGMTGAVALWAPPNNWDSMTYHMARVAHWIQDRDLKFWPTPFHPQLHNPPWSEYALLHLTLLKGSDRLVNLVQWFSMAGCCLGVSLVAAQLGAERRGQIASGFFCATLPMGILQATSTQNDYVAAFWLVCLVHFVLEFRSGPTLGNVLGAGVSLGLALLTKGTCFVFAAPLLLGLVVGRGRTLVSRLAAGAGCLGAVLLVAAALNAPQSVRNFELYGDCLVEAEYLDPEKPRWWEYKNEHYSASALASNLCRNVALQLVSPWQRGNELVERAVCGVHRFLGLDVNDPGTTFRAMRFEVRLHPGSTHHEDVASNLPHLLLLGGLAVASGAGWGLALLRGRGTIGATASLVGALALAFGLFCLTIRWQPWHARLHLPLFVLLAPAGGAGLARLRSPGLLLVTLVLGGWAVPYLVYNDRRPLLGEGNVRKTERRTQYFRAFPDLEPSYVGAASFLRQHGYKEVGLKFGFNDWEYPLWVLLTGFDPHGCRVEHVSYGPGSGWEVAARAINNHPAFSPTAVVRINHDWPPPPTIVLGGRTYRIGWLTRTITVYLEARHRRADLAAGELNTAGSYAMGQDAPVDRARRYWVVMSLQQEREHQAELIRSAFRQYLAREPSGAEVTSWIGFLQKEGNETQLRTRLLSSSEFYGRAGNTDRAWVNAVYLELVGHAADAAEEASWLGQLANGASRTAVAFGIATSPAGEGRLVRGYFEQYLGQTGGEAEVADLVSALDQGATGEEVLAVMLASPEFYGRVGSTDECWVNALFPKLLNRNAEADEEGSWLEKLAGR
jgi:4-amino-4-deoxy-L-arabinose transferase-like glycosyltransferase